MSVVFTLPTFKELKAGMKLFDAQGSPVGEDSPRRVLAQVNYLLCTDSGDLLDVKIYEPFEEQVAHAIKAIDTFDPLGVELQGVFLLGKMAYHRQQFETASAHASWCLEIAEEHGLYQTMADVSDLLVAIELDDRAQNPESSSERLNEIAAFATEIFNQVTGRADTFDLEWRLARAEADSNDTQNYSVLVDRAHHAPTEAQRAHALTDVLMPLHQTSSNAHVIDVGNAAIAAARRDLAAKEQSEDDNAKGIAAAQLVAACEEVAVVANSMGDSLADEHYNRLLTILQLKLDTNLQYFVSSPGERLKCLANFHAQKATLSNNTGRVKAARKNLNRAIHLYRRIHDTHTAAQLYLDFATRAQYRKDTTHTREFAEKALELADGYENIIFPAKELLEWCKGSPF